MTVAAGEHRRLDIHFFGRGQVLSCRLPGGHMLSEEILIGNFPMAKWTYSQLLTKHNIRIKK